MYRFVYLDKIAHADMHASPTGLSLSLSLSLVKRNGFFFQRPISSRCRRKPSFDRSEEQGALFQALSE